LNFSAARFEDITMAVIPFVKNSIDTEVQNPCDRPVSQSFNISLRSPMRMILERELSVQSRSLAARISLIDVTFSTFAKKKY
jgi:hypothetical protein